MGPCRSPRLSSQRPFNGLSKTGFALSMYKVSNSLSVAGSGLAAPCVPANLGWRASRSNCVFSAQHAMLKEPIAVVIVSLLN